MALPNSTFGLVLISGALQLPEDALLPKAEDLGPQPSVCRADEDFPLRRDPKRSIPGICLSSRFFENHQQNGSFTTVSGLPVKLQH